MKGGYDEKYTKVHEKYQFNHWSTSHCRFSNRNDYQLFLYTA